MATLFHTDAGSVANVAPKKRGLKLNGLLSMSGVWLVANVAPKKRGLKLVKAFIEVARHRSRTLPRRRGD